MIDLRLWRIVLLVAPVALVVAMFSLQEVPTPLQPTLPPDAFDGEAAALLAKELAAQAPEPRPGSEQDQALAEAVLARFKEIEAIEVSEQRFQGSLDGEEVELRNLIAILPGESERQVALMAHRDVAAGSGAASTIASTAALLEIASGFAGSTHQKTLVFVSSDGGSIGALGARRFARDYTNASQLDATIVLSQPGAPDPSQPLVLPWSIGTESTSTKLSQTASTVVSDETETSVGDAGAFSDLSRLAIPSALGEQGPLIESGLDSVRISSSGELPPPPSQDQSEDVDPETLDRFGRSALSLMLSVDGARSPLEQGPRTYIGLAGNLLPGWTLSLLALALLAPVGVAGFEGIARAAHSPLGAARSVGWVALRAVPFLLALAVVWLGALVGLIPSPEFPFLPGGVDLGLGGKIAVAIAVLLLASACFLLRPLLAPPPSVAAPAPAAAVSLAALVGLGVWLLNPYMALLVAIGLLLWVPAAAGVVPGRLAAAGLVAAGLVPVLAAVAALAGRFDAGLGIAWDLLLMLTGGQLGYGMALLGCLLAGIGLAIVAMAGEPAGPGAAQPGLREMIARGRLLEERRARQRAKSESGAARARRRGRGRAGSKQEPPPGATPPDEQREPARPEPAEPAQEDPAPDPRMWSKPPGSSSRPSRASTTIPSPSVIRPISVNP
jgi:hypothetical protein